MSRRRLLWLLVFFAPVGVGLFRVWVHQDVVRLGYALSQEEAERRRLQQRVQQLSVELAAEQAPARLRQLAQSLGLRAPAAGEVWSADGAGGAR